VERRALTILNDFSLSQNVPLQEYSLPISANKELHVK